MPFLIVASEILIVLLSIDLFSTELVNTNNDTTSDLLNRESNPHMSIYAQDARDSVGFLQGKVLELMQIGSPESRAKALKLLLDTYDSDKDGFWNFNETTERVIQGGKDSALAGASHFFQSKYDKDGDGGITLEEFKAAWSKGLDDETLKHYYKRFAAADVDDDDKLSLDEYMTFNYPVDYPVMKDVICDLAMKDFDKDKDGVLTIKTEFSKAQEAIATGFTLEEDVDLHDTDRNAVIDRNELWQLLINSSGRRSHRSSKELIEFFDTDKDSKLSLTELTNLIEYVNPDVGEENIDGSRTGILTENEDLPPEVLDELGVKVEQSQDESNDFERKEEL